MTAIHPTPVPPSSQHGASLTLVLSTALLLSFGGAMLLIAGAYIQDVQTLRALPEIVWAFVCGLPNENGYVLPLMLVLSSGAFIGVGLMWAWHTLAARSRKLWGALVVGTVVLSIVGGVLLARSSQSALDQAAPLPVPVPGFTILSTPRPVLNFALPSSTGETMRLSELPERYTLLFFGYTHCPDVCPLTLAEMTQLARLLDEQGIEANVLFVSVDGQRDTPEALNSYVSRFNPEFFAMSGNDTALRQLAPDYGLMYEAETPDDQGRYNVDHTSAIFVLDPQRRLTAVIGFGTGAQAMSDGLVNLMQSAADAS